MTPCALQAERPLGCSASVTGGPPATAIFFKFPPATNPTNLPSGDQNGYEAPSVPESLRASSEPSDRMYRAPAAVSVSAKRLVASIATNATVRPSGDRLSEP